MFRYLLLIVLLCGIASASEQCIDVPFHQEKPIQSLAESINLIINDLESGIAFLELDNVDTVRAHLYNVDEIAEKQLIKLIALVRAHKITGQDALLIHKLTSVFCVYHEKLLTVLPKKSNHVVDVPLYSDGEDDPCVDVDVDASSCE